MSPQQDFFDHQFELEFDNTPITRKSMLKEVVESILNEIKNNQDGHWVMPWSRTLGLPIKAHNGKPYRGRNMLLLWASASRNGYRSNRWATFKQWQQMHAPIPKGQKCTRIFRPVKRAQPNSNADLENRLTFRPVPVFNADQITPSFKEQGELIPLNLYFDESKAKELIDAIGAEIQHKGSSAYYNYIDDQIVIPPRNSFVSSSTSSADEIYYSTILHEIVHWTGHRSRCNRPIRNRSDTTEYAKEELVAEIGAATLCHNLGISPEIRPDHVQYIQIWKKSLNEKPETLIKAAEQAIQALKFLQQLTAQITLEF